MCEASLLHNIRFVVVMRPLPAYMVALTLVLLSACAGETEKTASAPVFVCEGVDTDTPEKTDLPQMLESGVVVAGTLYGEDTYYEYHGRYTGLQYETALGFARELGVRLRVEVSADTASLMDKLDKGEIDIVLLETPVWAVRKDAPLLSQALERWWKPSHTDSIRAAMDRGSRNTVKRKARPVMKDHKHGIISQYDHLFRRYSSVMRWDWRLLAAQCYQESCFDPRAHSWAGARGLMQIMPSTAEHLGLRADDVWDAETNISAACSYLKELQESFSDIRNARQRILFTLAAYNGGIFHIRDAMALARKYGADEQCWERVEPYVKGLSEPHYYRDPVVSNGYMRGGETSSYVRQIEERWQSYRSHARPYGGSVQPSPSKHSVKDDVFRSKVKSASEWVSDTTTETR